MEIPVINRIVTNMEIPNSFPIPNPISTNPLPSHFLSFPITQTYIFFKWGALVLALVASFTTLIKRLHILILSKSIKYSLQQPSVVQDFSDYESDSESGSDSDDDEPSASYSASSVSDTEEDHGGEEDFSIKGNGFGLRRRRSGSVLDLAALFTTGKNVVKLWDNVGLGLGSLAADNSNVLSSLFSPGSVVVSAEGNLSGRFLRVWDTRVSGWAPRVGRVKVSGSGGVVLSDDVTGGLAAGDVRKVGSPMVGITAADVDRWWDASGAVSSTSCSED